MTERRFGFASTDKCKISFQLCEKWDNFLPYKTSSLHLKWSRPDHKRTQLWDLLRGSTLDPVLNSLSRYAALQE